MEEEAAAAAAGTLFQSRDSSVLQSDCGRRSLTETDRLRSLHERQSEEQEEEEEERDEKVWGVGVGGSPPVDSVLREGGGIKKRNGKN